ncbi:hypothetical protein LCGC14_0960900 [marine sediment metagenome]|uniref:Uncharacterized protein n=1 Tax=marine sediment metagenome TaxID=412755 RepID=A0A0F9NJA1_9ZZZZ
MTKDQIVIDAYEAGDSYKTLGRRYKRSEHGIRDMIAREAPEIMRTRSEQASLAAKLNPAIRMFAPEDLGLHHVKPCKKCEVPMVGKVRTRRRQTCGLCKAFAKGIAA